MFTRNVLLSRVGLAMFAFAVASGAGFTTEVRADEFLVEAMGRVLEAANSLEDQSEFGYDTHGHVCLMGAFVSPGQSVELVREFKSGQRYAILAGGDSDASDIDIQLFDPLGTLIAEDTDADASPTVMFRSRASGKQKIRIQLYEASRPSFIFVAIMCEGGYHLPQQNQIDAAMSLLIQYQFVVDRFGGRLLSTKNNWAVYGSVLAGDESTTIDNVGLGSGRRVLVTGSDRSRSDLDLFVLDNKSEEVRHADEDEDSTPIVEGQFQGELNRIRTKNALANGEPTFVLTGILEVN